ncbi:MAG: fibronectin type III domain-containing protein [Ilumatobacteraceae bacterium]
MSPHQLPSGTPLECTLTGLTNGRAYRFAVRALNGAGWGPWSNWSDAVTPSGETRTITITGTRDRDTVRVGGSATGLTGKTVQAMVRFPGQTASSPGSYTRVNADQRFTWQRRAAKKTYVYFAHGDVSSNRIIISARRR